MGKKGKKSRAGKLTRKDIDKKLDAIAKKIEDEIEDSDPFAPLPPMDICPICLMHLSRVDRLSSYHACCGNFICNGCKGEYDSFVEVQDEKKEATKNMISLSCPFFREPRPSSEHFMRQIEVRASIYDANELLCIGQSFMKGEDGMPKDELKAFTYFIRSAELGSARACRYIGYYLKHGSAAFVNVERSNAFYLFGAMRGDVISRHIFGSVAYNAGCYEQGICHWKIAAEAGFQPALDRLKEIFLANGRVPGKDFVTKKYLDEAFWICHQAQKEVESDERKKHCDVEEYDDIRC